VKFYKGTFHGRDRVMMVSENFLPNRGSRYSVTAAQRSNMGFLETIPSGNAEFLFLASVAY
jgi:hypothetical protein